MSQVSPDIKALMDKGFACWNSGEIDLMADDYADDAEVDTTAAVPDGRCYKGREEFIRYFHDLWDAWDRVRMEPLNVAELGGGRFIVDRKVARVQMFPSKDAALQAVGLSE